MADTMQIPVLQNESMGTALPAAAGALFGSWFGQGWGGFGGWGNRGMSVGAGVADATIANAIEHVSDQVTSGNLAMQQLASNQNMFMGNLLNQTGDNITTAITQGTIAGMQNTQVLGDKLCNVNNNITTQGYESRLSQQQVLAAMQENCCRLSREVFEQGCANRELQRQIQSEQMAVALADAKATIASLQERLEFNNSQSLQTAAILNAISALKTTSTAG